MFELGSHDRVAGVGGEMIAKLELEVQRLRQFIEYVREETVYLGVAVDFDAALRGEWLWQQQPGWDKNDPAKRPL